VGDHDGGVDIQHDRAAQIGPGDPAGRDATVPFGDLRPHVAADPGPSHRDLLQATRGDLIQSPPHRRRRRDRPEHPALVAQHVDVGDRLTTISQHHRHVGQEPGPDHGRG